MTAQAVNMTLLKQKALSGQTLDVDFIMNTLDKNASTLLFKMVDYALGLVSTKEGRGRIQYYLYYGSEIQRNYSALYFKRRQETELLFQAVKLGCIEHELAFSQ